MDEIIRVGADAQNAEVVRDMMSLRDAEMKLEFNQKFPLAVSDKTLLAEEATREVARGLSHWMQIHHSYLFGLDYEVFKASAMAPYPYKQYLINGLPKNMLANLFSSSHPNNGSLEMCVRIESVLYDESLALLGMSKAQWYADVVPEVKKIVAQATAKTMKVAAAIRKASSNYSIIIFEVNRFSSWWCSLLVPENKDCCDDITNCITFWLVTFWFRLTAFIVLFPVFYIILLMGGLSGVLIDLISCYSCRATDEKKNAAVQAAMKALPECDFQAVDDVLKTDLEQLAVKLGNKYPLIKFILKANPFFVDGRYYKTNLPAHLVLAWRLDFYSKLQHDA